MTNAFHGLEMKQAARNRKHTPGGGEIAARVRDGALPQDLAVEYGISRTSVYDKLRDSGYKSDGTVAHTPRVRQDPDFMFRPEPWTEAALCADASIYDPEMWHAVEAWAHKAAKAVCSSCPVRLQCLDYGLRVDGDTRGGRHGIYGGLTGDERAALESK